LSRVYFIHDAQGERQLGEQEMPLPVGGAQHGGIVVPGLSDGEVVAYIGLAEGHAFIQPAETATQLFHNHEHMSASRWLKSGDLVEVGGSLIYWNVQGDQVEIRVRPRVASPVLEPPASPPPMNSRALPEVPQAPTPVRGRRFVRPLLLAMFVLLLSAVAFVLLATPVSVRITPEPQRQSLEGFPPPVPFGGRQLVLPGRYTVAAESPGYYPLQEAVEVPSAGFQLLEFQLEELPGQVSIELQPDVAFKLFVNDVALPVDAGRPAEIGAGAQRLRIETERYLPMEATLNVLGKGQAQQVNYVLQPAWADVHIDSAPRGATLLVDGETIGQTPLQIEILQGVRELVLRLEQHKEISLRQQVQAGTELQLGPFELQTLDGRLSVSSVPEAASLSVDGVFHGTTPLTLPLTSGVEHELRLSKPGFERFEQKVNLGPDQEQSIEARLQPQYGIVFVTAQPADASLRVDGRDVGKATQRLQLTTRSHKLEFSKSGYVSKTVNVTPRAGSSKNVDVTLASVAAARSRKQVAATPAVKTSPGGQQLRLVRPEGAFRMGASRREQGRRANESARQVKLVRPFYLSGTEVSNAEYRKFKPAHSSGFAEGQTLDADKQPVVGVSWEDAALYANWLSRREGLPPAYKEVNGRLQAVRPMTTGYRLPSEAEWAYVARRHGRPSEQRYPWKGSFPPTSVTGNFADASIADTLANTVPDYNDGHRVSAPVASFAARPTGFHDLGGNVAEWIHDFYAVYPGEAGKLVSDPLGPAAGDHHVVRDSSWRQGTITELRLSYRDYSRAARPDLGFRVARYAK
jgi:formylglycine-generating enzyme required for sulfatase activity